MFEDLETKSARRAVWFTLGGAMLMVSGYWGLRYFTHIVANSLTTGAPPAHDAIGAVGAPLALGLSFGMALFYMGAARLLIGPRLDELDVKRLTAPGLLYALGFAACLAAVGWLVVGHFGLDPFGG